MNSAPAHAPADKQSFPPGSTLILKEIADLLGRDITTIKRWIKAGLWANASKDPDGRCAWRVPVADLVASGHLDAAQVTHVENELAARRESSQTRELREQVIRLEEQLSAARALADERNRTITLLQDIATAGGAA